jgi:hypothetical protein
MKYESSLGQTSRGPRHERVPSGICNVSSRSGVTTVRFAGQFLDIIEKRRLAYTGALRWTMAFDKLGARVVR